MINRVLALLAAMVCIAAAWMVGEWVWPRVPEGFLRRTAMFGEREVRMIVMEIPGSPEAATEMISHPDEPKSVRAWREELGADFVFNAAYFGEDGEPTGYWKTGKGTEPRIAWPSMEAQADPHGYTFLVQKVPGGFAMSYLPSDPSEEPPTGNAFLSFPTLVADGEPTVEVDSGLRARRTALAEDAHGTDYLIVTERGELTLYELSRWLAEQPEEFVVAGNLDGGPSTGVSIANNGRDIEVLSVQVPSVIAVYLRR